MKFPITRMFDINCAAWTRYPTAIALASSAMLLPLPVAAQTPIFTVETVSPYQEVLRPGNTLNPKYKFSVNGSTTTNYRMFVHVIDATNTIRLQDDHPPPINTSTWSNVNAPPRPDVTWTRPPIVIPNTFPTGNYRIVVGLYNTANGSRLALAPGNYVSELSAGSKSYVVSYLTVTSRTIRNASFTCGDIYTPESSWPVVPSTQFNADLAAVISGTSSAPGEIYKLPQGGCRYSTNLLLNSKTNIDIVGAGVMDTTLAATNSEYSALKISNGNKVRVRDFSLRTYPGPTVYACTDHDNRTAQRSTQPTSTGILIDRGSNISVERTRIGPVFSSGIFFGAVNGGNATANEIYDTLADGIHVTLSIDSNNTTPSTNIIVQNNVAKNTGDDSFSSVGTLQTPGHVVIQGTQVKNNRSTDSCTSGVTVEGTSGATVSGNVVTRSGMAGIRVASTSADWHSPTTTAVTVTGNTLDSVRMSCEGDHPALLVYSTYQAVLGITISGNTITNPRSPYGIRAYATLPGTVGSVSATNNTFTVNPTYHPPCANGSTANLPKAACVVMEPSVSNPTVSGNTFNSTACP